MDAQNAIEEYNAAVSEVTLQAKRKSFNELKNDCSFYYMVSHDVFLLSSSSSNESN